MPRILILANNDIGLYKFRKELIQQLVKKYELYISLPYGGFIPKLKELGCEFIETPISRRGTNPITEFNSFIKYISIVKNVKPDLVLTYTVKPNVYGGIACRITGVPYIANITGLGSSLENVGVLQKLVLILYHTGLKKASCVFFQNKSNREFILDKGIVPCKTRLIPGSGINLAEYCLEEYPENVGELRFLFIGRIMKDKGICELLDAAVSIKSKYPNVRFDLIGDIEEDYTEQIKKLESQSIVKYYGHQNNVKPFIKNSHATIIPSYHEGMSNVLLESAAIGRPVLASRVPGCKETFDEGISGFGFEPKNVDSLVKTIIKFIELPYEKKKQMGIAGRRKMEKEFDRNIVIKAYLEEINKIIEPVKGELI